MLFRPYSSVLKALLLGSACTALTVTELNARQQVSQESKSQKLRIAVSGRDALALATRLVEQGELDKAEVILQGLVHSDPEEVDHMQVAFLAGTIATRRGHYKEAVEIYRQILDVDPSLVAVRLELATNLFQIKDDRAAEYHFKLALESDLPPAAKATIVEFLNKIEARRFWRYGFEISIAPDTNISSGSSEDQIFIDVGEGDARQEVEVTGFRRETSGVGLNASLSGSYTPHIKGPWWGEARGALFLTDYGNERFDSAYEYVEVGPSYRGKKLQVSVLANAAQRQLGNDNFASSMGSRLILRTPLSARTGMVFRMGVTETDYDQTDTRDGKIYNYGLRLSRAFGKQTFGSIDVNINNDRAQFRAERNVAYSLAVSVGRELGYGITARVTPQFNYRDYVNRDQLLDARRLDRGYGLGVSLTKRDWRIRGFAPVFGYQYFINTSNSPLHEFDRHSFEFGLTRNF